MNVHGGLIAETINQPEEKCVVSMQNRSYYDAEIKASIFRTLTWYSRAPLDEVTINVKHGYVSLSGSVPFPYQKMVIESTVQCIKGVKGINNTIRVVSYLPSQMIA